MIPKRPTYSELEKRLASAEPIIEALKHHEVDAVVGKEKIAVLLLQEVGEELQNSDAAFRAIFELGAVGMIQADTPNFRLTRVNQKFCEMTGYSAPELLVKTHLELAHPHDRAGVMRELSRVLRGQSDSWATERRCLRKDGTFIWVAVNGTVLRDDAGRVVRIIAMIRDITGGKQAEQTLRLQAAKIRKLAAELARCKKTRKTSPRHGRSP
jgi:PAS domain S-box-containing protein